jgi:hypothetical protein
MVDAPTLTRSAPRKPWNTDEGLALQILALYAFAVAFALIPVNRPPAKVPVEPQASPYGYTLSLLLFAVPLVRVGGWLAVNPQLKNQRRAGLTALVFILPAWLLLDLLLGLTFFEFPNPGATLGWFLPGWSPTEQAWVLGIPIEEFLFYSLGIAVIQLSYIWGSETWFRDHTHSDDDRRAAGVDSTMRVDARVLGIGLIAFAAALGWKKLLAPAEYGDGFPGYFLFLLISSILPSMMFLRVVRPFVNWRAFSFATFTQIFIFLLWEVTLAMPYQYWSFRDEQMMGVFVLAWGRLPIEEPFLWIAAGWLNMTMYELIRLRLANRERAPQTVSARMA